MENQFNRIHFRNIYFVLLTILTIFLSYVFSVLTILNNEKIPYDVKEIRQYCIFHNPFKGILIILLVLVGFVVVVVAILDISDLFIKDIFILKERKNKSIFIALLLLLLFEFYPDWLILIAFYAALLYAILNFLIIRDFYKSIKSFTLSEKEKLEEAIENLKKVDPNFSLPLFYDFALNVFYNFYTNLNNIKHLKNSVSVYFDSFLFKQIINPALALKNKSLKKLNITNFILNRNKIIDLVITGISISEPEISPKSIYVDFYYELFYTQKRAIYKKQGLDIWHFSRETTISQEPQKMHELSCPICGAPANFTDDGVCKYCGNKIIQGKHQWYVSHLKTDISFTQKVKKAVSLLPQDEEEDFNFLYQFISTFVKSPKLQENIEKFEQKYHKNWDEFFENFKQNIVIPYFNQIYKSWSEQDWIKVRHLVSDNTWQNWNFRLKLYKENNLEIHLTKNIKNIELSEVYLDKYYDTITVKITSEFISYITLKNKEKIIIGSKQPRSINEYWTFVRYAGKEPKHFDLYTCPSCGASIKFMGETGICQYCGQKVSNGQFYWVVFQILYQK